MPALKFIRNLNDAYDDFVWVAIFIQEVKPHQWVVAVKAAFHMYHLVILQMFFYFFLQQIKCICEINFKWAGVVGRGFHRCKMGC